MTNKRASSLLAWVWLVMILCLGGYAFNGLFIQNKKQFDLLSMLPSHRSEKLSHIQSFLEDTRSHQHFFIFVGHKNPDIAEKAYGHLREALQKDLGLTAETSHTLSEEQMAFFKALYPYRSGLLSSKDRTLLLDKKFDQITQNALKNMAGPMGGMDLKGDPFAFFTRFAQEHSPHTSIQSNDKGDLFIPASALSEGKTWFIYKAYLSESGLSLKAQEKLMHTLEPLLQKISLEGLDILRGGAVFYAMSGFHSAQKDIFFIGLLSMMGIIILMLSIFKSVKPLFFALTVISVGIITGISACLFIFGSIHIIALVFGCSLVGITVDYAIHYTCAFFERAERDPSQSILSSLMPALPLGVISSVFGYALMFLVPFPGIQQMALLTSVGLISAFITVVLWGRWIFQTPQQLPLMAQFLQNTLRQFTERAAQKKVRWFFGVTMSLLFAGGLGFFHFDDTLQGLQSLDVMLKKEEAAIQSLTQMKRPTQFMVVSEKTAEALLQKEEEMLDVLHQKGIPCQGISQFIPSQKRQRENQNQVKTFCASQWDIFKKITGYEGSNPYMDSLLDLHQVVLPTTLKPLLHREKEAVFSRILLLQASGPEAILGATPEVIYIDIPEEYTLLFSHYRLLIFKLILSVTLGILGILALRVKMKEALRIVFPVGLSLLATLGIIGPLMPFNLFHAMGLLMTLCIGIDYALFLYWRDPEKRGDLFFLGNSLAAMTTILSFGLLMLSNTTAVKSFGFTIFIGICLCFVSTLIFLGYPGKARENQLKKSMGE